jgi:hypothetical protein
VHRHRRAISAALVAVVMAACGGGQQIVQPSVGELPVAPAGDRVDLVMPSFSKPTEITNPLFPVSRQSSVLLVGTVDDQAFRTEVTLLHNPRIIEWEGTLVATLVSQYVAFLDGRLHEVAYDFYAQADDGSVWYFGEDVFNFTDGAIVDTHGTWIAGADGPAAMIMPADPQVGVVYRPENIPGFVFEEVTVTEVGRTLDGPFAPVTGGLVVSELHVDGGTEEKTFAPGYGEFYTAAGGDIEALALAVPTDAVDEPVPDALAAMEAGATEVLAAATGEDWDAAGVAADDVAAAWDSHDGDVPVLLDPLVTAALAALADAVDGQDVVAAQQAAIDVSRLSLDLQLRHRPVVEIDIARFGLWADQLALDASEEHVAAVRGDAFALDYMRDRILHNLDAADAASLNQLLEELNGLVADGDMPGIAEIAAELRGLATELVAR